MAFNKFKTGTSDVPAGTGKAKPRGGWEDDDDDNQPQIKSGTSGPYKGNQPFQPAVSKDTVKSPLSSSSNKSDDLAFVSSNKKVNPSIEYEICQIDDKFLDSHEYENKMIMDLIQPGGARIKQSDSDLAKFCKACESFQVAVAGSLLLCKLYEDMPYVSKARDLFLIEALAKKVKKYFEFFKHNLNLLKDLDFSNEGQNAAQLTKIKDDIVKYIENPEKLKPVVNLISSNVSSTSQSSDTFGETDLLGGGSNKEKQDPFAFIKKSGPESTQSQPFTQGADLLDMNSSPPSFNTQQQQPQFVPQTQPFNQPQAQPKKFDPFGIASAQSQSNNQQQAQTQPQNIPQPQTQPKQGPGLNFKKFQSGASFSEQSNVPTEHPPHPQVQVTTANLQQNVKETQQTSPLDQLDDLLANFSGLDFSGNKVEPSNPSQGNHQAQGNASNTQQQTNNQFQQGPPQTQNQGFGGQQNQGFAGGFGTQNQQPSFQQGNLSQGQPGSFPQTQGMGQQMQPNMQNQFNPQFYPQYGGPAPQGYWGRGYPPQGYPQPQPQPGYFPGPGYGYNQPQFGQGGYPNPQQFGGFQGQPGMYGNTNFQGQGQQNAPNNPSQGQFGMQGKK